MEVRTDEDYHEALRLRAEAGTWIFLGASDHQVEGTWVWATDNSTVNMNSYWNLGSPDSRAENVDFLCMGSNGKLYDCYGTTTLPFVCSFN